MKVNLLKLWLFFGITGGFFYSIFFGSFTYGSADWDGLYGKNITSTTNNTLSCPNGANAGNGSYTVYSGKSLSLNFIFDHITNDFTQVRLYDSGAIFEILPASIIPNTIFFAGKSDGYFTGVVGEYESILMGNTASFIVSKPLGATDRSSYKANIYFYLIGRNYTKIAGSTDFYQTFYPNPLVNEKFDLQGPPSDPKNYKFCYQVYVGFCGDGVVDNGNYNYVFKTGIFVADTSNGVLKGQEQCDDDNNTDGDGCSSTCKLETPPSLSLQKKIGNFTNNGVCDITYNGSYYKGQKVCYKITLTNTGGDYNPPGSTIIISENPSFDISSFVNHCEKLYGSFSTCNISYPPNSVITLSNINTLSGGGGSLSFIITGIIDDNILYGIKDYNWYMHNYIKIMSGSTELAQASSHDFVNMADISINGSIGSTAGKNIGDEISFDLTITNTGNYLYSGLMVLSGDLKNMFTDMKITKQLGSSSSCISYYNYTIASLFDIDIIPVGSYLVPGGRCIYKITGKLTKFFPSTIFQFYAGYPGGPDITMDINNPEPAFSPYFRDNNKLSLSSSFTQSGTCILDKKVKDNYNNRVESRSVNSGLVVEFLISGYNNTNASRSGSSVLLLKDTLTPYDMPLSMEYNPLFDYNQSNKTVTLKPGKVIPPGSGFMIYLTGLITDAYYSGMFNGVHTVINTISGSVNLSSIGGTTVNCNNDGANISVSEQILVGNKKYLTGDNFYMSGGDKVYYFTIGDTIDYFFKLTNIGNTGNNTDNSLISISDVVYNPMKSYLLQNTILLNGGYQTVDSSGVICGSGLPTTITNSNYFRSAVYETGFQTWDMGGYCIFKLSFDVTDFTGSGVGSDGCIKIRDNIGIETDGDGNDDDNYANICIYKPSWDITKTIGTGFDGSGYVTGSDHFNIGDNYIYQICATLKVASGVVVDTILLQDIFPEGLFSSIEDIDIDYSGGDRADPLFMGNNIWQFSGSNLNFMSGGQVCITISGNITEDLEAGNDGSFVNKACYGDPFLSGTNLDYSFTGCIQETGFINRTDIGITKSLTGNIPIGGYTVGDTISFAIMVYNSGDRAVTGWTIKDTDIVDGAGGLKLDLDNIIIIPGSCGGLYSTDSTFDGDINFPSVVLQPGSSCTFIISGTITEILSSDGFCTNTTLLTGINPNETTGFVGVIENNTYTLSGINCEPLGTGALQVTKTANKTTNYVLGEYIDYTITITNTGPGKVYGFTLEDILPSGITYVGPMDIEYPSGTHIPYSGLFPISFDPNAYTLSSGEKVIIKFTGQVTTGGNLCNTATANRDFDTSPWNDTTNYTTSSQVCVDVVAPSCTGEYAATVTLEEIDGGNITVSYTCPDIPGMTFDRFIALDPDSIVPGNIIVMSSSTNINGLLTFPIPNGFDINDPNSLISFMCDYDYPNNFTGGKAVTCFREIDIPKPTCELINPTCSYNDGIKVTCTSGNDSQGDIVGAQIFFVNNDGSKSPTTPPTVFPPPPFPLSYIFPTEPTPGTDYNFSCIVQNQYGLTGSCEVECGIPNDGQCNVTATANPNSVAPGDTSTVTATCNITDSQGGITITNFTSTIPGSSRSPGSNSWTISNVPAGTYNFTCNLSNGQTCPGSIEIIEITPCPQNIPATCEAPGTTYGLPPTCAPTEVPQLTGPECDIGPACGTAAIVYTSIDDFPEGVLCNSGDPDSPEPEFNSTTNTRNWTCNLGGQSTGCIANYNTGPIDGLCPLPPATIPYSAIVPSNSNYNATCSPGTVSQLSCTPSTPGVWTSCTWICEGINGGSPSGECEVTREFCGDKKINGPSGSEQCDDGNTIDDDDCSNTCKAKEPDCKQVTISPDPEYFMDDLPGNFQVTCSGTSPSILTISNTSFNQQTMDGSISVPGTTFTQAGTYVFNCNHTINGQSEVCHKEIEIKTREWQCPPANTNQVLGRSATPSFFKLSDHEIAIGGTANIDCENIAVNPSGGTKTGDPKDQAISVTPSENTTIVGTNITFTKEGNYTVSCNFDIPGGTNPYKCDYNIEVLKPSCDIPGKIELTNNEEEYADVKPFPPSRVIEPPKLQDLFVTDCYNTIGINGYPYQYTNLRKGEYELRCKIKPKINPIPEGFPADLLCKKSFSVLPVGAGGKCKNMIIVNGKLVPNNGDIELPAGNITVTCLDTTYTPSPDSVYLTGSNSPLTVKCTNGPDLICIGTVKVKPSTGDLSCNPNGTLEAQNGEECDPKLNNSGSPSTNDACNSTDPKGYCTDQCKCKLEKSTVDCGQGVSITLQGPQTLNSTVNISCAGGQIVSGFPNYTLNGGSPISNSTINITATGDYEATCKVSTGGVDRECKANFTIEGNTPDPNQTGCQNLFILPPGPYKKVSTDLSFSCIGVPTDASFLIQLKKSDGTALTSFTSKNGSYNFTQVGNYIATCKVGDSDQICTQNIEITEEVPKCEVLPLVTKEDEYGQVEYDVKLTPSVPQSDFDIQCGFYKSGYLLGYQESWGGIFSSIRKGTYKILCSIKPKTQSDRDGPLTQKCEKEPINILPVGAAGKCKDAISIQVGTKISDNPYIFTTQSSTVTVSCNGGMTLQGPSTLDMMAQSSYDVSCIKGDIVCPAQIKSEPRCGDKQVQADKGEECDQGDQNGKDGINCTDLCKLVNKNMNCPANLSITPPSPTKNQTVTIKCDGIGGEMKGIVNGPAGSSNLPGNGPNLSATFVPTADGTYNATCTLSSGGLSMECGQGSFTIGSGDNPNDPGSGDSQTGDYDPDNDPNLYDLAISKSVISDTTQIGSSILFEIVVNNEGLLTATGFSIKDLTSGFSKVQVGRSLNSMRNYNGDITKDMLLAYPLSLSGRSSQKFYMSGILQSSGFVNKVQVCDYNSDLDADSESCNGYDKGEDDDAMADGDIYSSIIGDFVWNDKDKNGLQTTGEQGIRDIGVVLVGCEDNKIISTTTTDTAGKYAFSKTQPGDYRVGFLLPGGYKFTQSDIGANDLIDSDVSSWDVGSSTGYTSCFTTIGGVNKLNQDAGIYFEGATLSVTKEADRKFVTTGEYVKWFITFKNTSNTLITSYTLKDIVPPGMRYVSIYLSGEQESLDACGYPSSWSGDQTILGKVNNAHIVGGVECTFVLTTQVKDDSIQKLHTNEICVDGPSFDDTCAQAQVEQISLCKNISLDKDFGDNPLDVNFTCTLSGSSSGYVKIFDATEKILDTFGLSGKYTFNSAGNYYIECVSNFVDRCIRPIQVRELSECTDFLVTERSTQDYDITCKGKDVQDMQIRVYEGYIDPISQGVVGQVVYQTGGSVGRYKIGGGSYVFQCLVNGSVDYKYDYLSGAKSPLYSCYYKNLPNGAICAVKTQVTPFKVSVPNFKDFKYIPEPITYCPDKGNLTCNTFQESKLMVKDYVCRKSIVIPQPDIVVSKTGNKLIYSGKDTIDYKVNFYNSGDGKVDGFKLVDDLPAGMELVSWSGSFSFVPVGLTNTIIKDISTNIFLQSGAQLSWNIQGIMGDYKPVILSGYLHIKTKIIEDLKHPLKNKMFGIVVDDSYLPNNLGQYTVYPSGWNFSGDIAIGDKVWSDKNFDGIQDPLEKGVKNIRVELMNCSGQIMDYTYSDAKGYYKFDDIMSGYYKVAATLNKNWIFTYGKIGRNDVVDSDIVIGNTTNCRYISGSTSELNIDIGLYDISQYPEGSCNYNNIWEENLGEQCDGDDGIKGNYEKCIKCTKFTYNSVCGDGVLQPNEDCEKNSDGKYNDVNITGTTCVDCKFYSGAVCGNGIIENDEQCEVNSAPVKGLQCIGCQLIVNTLAECGNGIQEVGEACDLGISNGTFATIGGSGQERDMRCSANCNIINCDYNFCFKPKPPSCTRSYSPNVMVGEYFPFWRDIDDRLIINGDSCVPGKIPVGSVMCYFTLYNGKQGTSNPIYEFMQPCISLSTYNQTLLSFFNPISASFMGRGYIYMDSNKVNDIYGEYKLSLDKVTYNVCGNSGDVSKKQINGVDLIGGTSQSVICEYNFTVTRPFLIQIGNNISTNQTDKLKNFYGFASNQGKMNILDQYSIPLNLLTISKFTINNNISYLINQFVSKVDKLSVVDIRYGPKAKKVPSSNIFVYDGDLVYSENTKPTSQPHTIVLRRGSLTISGTIGGQNMFIVQDGDITFAGGCDTNQVVNGVFITNGKLLSDKNYQNTNLLNKWCNGGGLTINGFVIGDGLDDLVTHRRANLHGWFLDDSRYGKYNAIMNGGSVVIKQNIGLSTSPPPGFNEFSSIYETIKK